MSKRDPLAVEVLVTAEVEPAIVAARTQMVPTRRGLVHYDRQRGRWRSEFDEWQQRQAQDCGPA